MPKDNLCQNITSSNFFLFFDNKLFFDYNNDNQNEELYNEFYSNYYSSKESLTNIKDEEKLLPSNLLSILSIKESDLHNEDLKKNTFMPNQSNENKKNINESLKKDKNYVSQTTTLLPQFNKLNINNYSFIPNTILFKNFMKPNNYNQYYNNKNIQVSFNVQNNINYNINKDIIKNNEKKKKNKKEFTEREGDWLCYHCKNINFTFRNKFNKFHLLKEESEKKYTEAGQKILKWINLSKKKN